MTERMPGSGESDFLQEACDDEPAFAMHLDATADPLAERWATLCLGLAGYGALTHDQKARVRDAIMHRPRREVVKELAGFDLPSWVVAMLVRLLPVGLCRDDVKTLAGFDVDRSAVDALSKLDELGPLLVTQIARVPPHFRTVQVFLILNHLALSSEFWRDLECHLAELSPDLAGSIVAEAAHAASRGAFLDAVSRAWEKNRENLPFAGQPASPSFSMLSILDRPSAIETEAQRMENCLASYRLVPESGDIAYGAWYGREPATVELIRDGNGWQARAIRGWKNGEVSAETRIEVEAAVRALSTKAGPARPPIQGSYAFVTEQARDAAGRFPAALIAAMRGVLQSIQGQSLGPPGKNAYCVFEYHEGYVQFLADVWGEAFLCEISSHKYVPAMEHRLTEAVFRFVHAAGFCWPKGTANFALSFRITTTEQLDVLAQFALATLATIMGFAPDAQVVIRLRVPQANA